MRGLTWRRKKRFTTVVKMSDKQLGQVLGINHRKVCQSVPTSADRLARIEVADPLTYHLLMAEAHFRVQGELASADTVARLRA